MGCVPPDISSSRPAYWCSLCSAEPHPALPPGPQAGVTAWQLEFFRWLLAESEPNDPGRTHASSSRGGAHAGARQSSCVGCTLPAHCVDVVGTAWHGQSLTSQAIHKNQIIFMRVGLRRKCSSGERISRRLAFGWADAGPGGPDPAQVQGAGDGGWPTARAAWPAQDVAAGSGAYAARAVRAAQHSGRPLRLSGTNRD